jgi:hypothetical protein
MTELFTENNEEIYLPSSSEKKQACLMYFFVGLLLSMGKTEVSPYTYHHIKQAMGWIILLILCVFLDVALFILGAVFGKFFSILGLLITLPVLILGIVCVSQARKGEYKWQSDSSLKFFGIFSGLGVWILNLFDSNHYQIVGDHTSEPQQNVSDPNLTQFGINDQIGKPLS